jgi:hypothetical protein
MSVKYGFIGVCAGFAFAILVVFLAARWNVTPIAGTFITDVRGR